jgi:integrase
MQLGISTSLDSVTAQYVDVRLDRKKIVLDAYHNAIHPTIKKESSKKTPKKNLDMER